MKRLANRMQVEDTRKPGVVEIVWMARVPYRVAFIHMEIEQLRAKLKRQPTYQELADHFGELCDP